MTSSDAAGVRYRLNQRRLIIAMSALVILTSTWLMRPYTYMTNNHALQLPLVHSLRAPELYPNDPLVDTFGTYSSWYWTAVAKSDFVPTRTLLGIVYFLTVAGGLGAVYLLCAAFGPGSRLAPWIATAAFALGVRPFIGGGTIARCYPEQTSLAVVFFILLFAAVAARRPWLSAIAYSLGFFMNPLYGIHVGLYVVAFGLLATFHRILDRRWGLAALLALLIVLPAVLWGSQTASALDLPDSEFAATWADMLHNAGPWHFFPPTDSLMAFFTIGTVIVTTLLLSIRDPDRWRGTLVRAAIAAAVFWIAASYVIAYVLPPSRLLMLQAPRGADLFWVVALVYFISRLCTSITADRPGEIRSEIPCVLPWAGILGLLVLYNLVNPKVAAALVLVPSAVPGICKRAVKLPAEAGSLLTATGLLMLALLTFTTAPADERGLFLIGPGEAMRATAAWARENTPIDAVFMANPGADVDEYAMFRPLSQRSCFVFHKDGAAIHWHAQYLTEFSSRMGALGMASGPDSHELLKPQDMDRLWRQLPDAHLLAVAREYGIDYAVFDRDRETTFPVVFENGSYRVVRLAGTSDVDTPP
jgi:hypothetical protein